jgi:LysR family glycine cleavage system transcriptional activator
MHLPADGWSPACQIGVWHIPEIALQVIGTDSVIDLRAGDADVAIRYARKMPTDFVAQEIFRDTFFPVCTPTLLEKYRAAHPTRRGCAALSVDPDVPSIDRSWKLSFREELHAIDAVIAGQGMAICSDIVVSHELRSGALVKAHDLSLPGYGYYLVNMPHSREPTVKAFATWMRSTIWPSGTRR